MLNFQTNKFIRSQIVEKWVALFRRHLCAFLEKFHLVEFIHSCILKGSITVFYRLFKLSNDYIKKKVNRTFLVKTEKHCTACDNRQVMEIFEKLPYLCFHIALGLKSRPPPLQCQLGWCHDYFAIRPTQPTQPIYCNRGRLCIHMESIYNGRIFTCRVSCLNAKFLVVIYTYNKRCLLIFMHIMTRQFSWKNLMTCFH